VKRTIVFLLLLLAALAIFQWRRERRQRPVISAQEVMLPADGGLHRVGEARLYGRPRTSTRRLQHPLFFDLHDLLTDPTFQFGYPTLRPARLPVARKRVARCLPELTPPTLQHVRVDLQPPCHLGQRNPASSRRTATSLNSWGTACVTIP